MFDDVPNNQQPSPSKPVGGEQPLDQNVQSPPSVSPTPGEVSEPEAHSVLPAPTQQQSVPAHNGGAIPLPATAIPGKYAADQETLDMFKRESLSMVQKIILIIVTVLVIGSLIGGGIWLYMWLDPLNTTETKTTINQTPININSEMVNSSAGVVSPQNIDSDRDGLTDETEDKYGTDPNDVDSDGDLLSDYNEIEVYKTKPLVTDTDGDGYIDGDEVSNGYDPNGPGKL